MKNILKYILVYISLILIFIITLLISCSFPTKMIHSNISQSADTLIQEGNRKIVYIPYRREKLQFDNYTDALMINTSYSIDSKSPLKSSLLARKNYLPEKTKTIEQDNVGELKSSSKYQYHNEVGELKDLVNNDVEESFEYARYWHGYLVFLRPLMLFLNLDTIRVILTIILFVLFIMLFYLLEKRTNIIISIIFSLGLFCVEYFYLGFTLQGVFVFLISMIFSIVILVKKEKWKNEAIMFFIIGMLTNFFDFLTVPMITLGIPLIIVLLLNSKDLKNNLIDMIKLSLLWVLGYGLTWFTKWVLVDVILNRNLISTAIGQIKYRSIGRKYTLNEAIKPNYIYEKSFIYVSMIITVILTILYYKFGKKKIKVSELKEIVPYILIGMMPYIWYGTLKNHSAEHSFFTYRNQLLTIICLNICVYKTLSYFLEKGCE